MILRPVSVFFSRFGAKKDDTQKKKYREKYHVAAGESSFA